MMSERNWHWEWQREGQGWIARWVMDDGDYSDWSQLTVCPAGGFHGGWRWRANPSANMVLKGKHFGSLREAKRLAQAVYEAVEDNQA